MTASRSRLALLVTAADGVWRVELGNPSRTESSGLTCTTAKVGDPIVVLGNRDQDREQRHMKAVRITLAGQGYDVYPERTE